MVRLSATIARLILANSDAFTEGADDPAALNQQRNKKALEAIRRVRDKLTGEGFLLITIKA